MQFSKLYGKWEVFRCNHNNKTKIEEARWSWPKPRWLRSIIISNKITQTFRQNFNFRSLNLSLWRHFPVSSDFLFKELLVQIAGYSARQVHRFLRLISMSVNVPLHWWYFPFFNMPSIEVACIFLILEWLQDLYEFLVGSTASDIEFLAVCC